MNNESLIKNSNKTERVMYFDVLNIFACISVIFLHMNGIVHKYSDTIEWKTALIFEVIGFWAVPIFIMLTGATLFNYRERYDTKTFFKKRFMKVLIPWIVWSFIISVIRNNWKIDILSFVLDFSYCRIEITYWFFPMILSLYCLIPIFSIFTQKEEYRKILKGIVVYFFIVLGIIKPMCLIFDINVPDILGYLIIDNGFIMFLPLGYLLSTTEIPKKKRVVLYILGIISILFRYIYTYIMSMKEGILNRDLFDYCSAPSILLAVAVFVFVKNINWEKIKKQLSIDAKMLKTISSCSFGIYLIHIVIRDDLTYRLNLRVYDIWYRTIGAIWLYIICFGIIYTIKKIPIIKKIVP